MAIFWLRGVETILGGEDFLAMLTGCCSVALTQAASLETARSFLSTDLPGEQHFCC